MNLSNGSRVPLSLPDFVGDAGFKRQGDRASLAYTPNKLGKRPAAGTIIPIEGEDWEVVKAGDSLFIRTMLVVELARTQAQPLA